MPRKEIVKRLVEEIGEIDTSKDDDVPLEYLEMREVAKARVILKSSVKAHSLIYGLVNIFLLFTNFFADPNPINHFFEVWSVWVILGWGLLLWTHFVVIWGILSVKHVDKKIFVIISLILGYIALLLIYTNYIVIHYSNTDFLWWYWAAGGIALIIGSYAYIVYEIDESSKKKRQIDRELKIMRGSA
jgi:hypothetical protein